MIKGIDMDQNGKIDFSEFVFMMTTEMGTLGSDDSLRAAFRIFDQVDY